MDRKLPSEFKKNQLIRRIALTSIILLLILVAFVMVRLKLKPSIDRSAIIIKTAVRGTISATIMASGVVVPENEYLMISPIHAKIEKVIFPSGAAVKKGESILLLNKEATLTKHANLLDEQLVNHNRIQQLNLSLDRRLDELNTQYEIKKMNIQRLETSLNNEQSLLNIGGSTPEKVKQAGLNLSIAKLEIAQLKNQIINEKKTTQYELQSLGYQVSIQQKGIVESQKTLGLAEVRAPARGTITWVIDKTGAEVSQGSELVKIADLSSFKIEGTLAEAYAGELKTGGKVIVNLQNASLSGQITNIQPLVENAKVKFFVKLDQRHHQLLRANLKADLHIVTAEKDNVIKVKNGPAFTGSEQQKVYVLKGKDAIPTLITVGLSNFEEVEIVSGIKPGDKVIVGGVEEISNVHKVRVKN